MTKLESDIEGYLYFIPAIENNLRICPEDESRKRHLKQLKAKLKLARKLIALGLEDWPPRQVSVLRLRLKAARDLRYRSIQSRS